MPFGLMLTVSQASSANIVFTCSRRACVVLATLADAVLLLVPCVLRAMACARLPGSTMTKTTRGVDLAAGRGSIVCGITTPAHYVSTTSTPFGRSRRKHGTYRHLYRFIVQNCGACIVVAGLLNICDCLQSAKDEPWCLSQFQRTHLWWSEDDDCSLSGGGAHEKIHVSGLHF